MPEGDTIHHAAARIRPVLEGHVPDTLRTPHPRFGHDRWDERLAGRAIRSVDALGKHLFLRFEDGLTIHSHLRMSGAWAVHDAGTRWRRSPRRAWLVLARDGREVVQFDGPVLELLTDARVRNDPRIARLGADILAPQLDLARILRRLREDDPTRPIGDALLDQHIVAGIGNLWKCEACWAAQVDPWRPASRTSDAEIEAMLTAIRPRMQAAVERGMGARDVQVYDRAGRACPRCDVTIRVRGQGDGNRPTYWCPGCQS
jgi:endonuclease-8